MATVHLFLDVRTMRGSEAQIKIGINKKSSSAYIPLGQWVQPSQWDRKREQVKNHPHKMASNQYVLTRRTEVQNLLMRLTSEGQLTKLTATQIKNRILEELEPDAANQSFIRRMEAFCRTREAQSTREKYELTMKRVLEYDPKARTITFEEINREWLEGLDRFLMQYNPSKNGRAIHLRNIRAVFNDAIDNSITANYPFRKFKIRHEETAKRSLTVEQLRELFAYPVEPYQKRYLDMFKLSFFLIGINVTDLCLLYEISNDGYLVYKRAKTKKLYSIKVEPEAMEIIDRYRGTGQLLNLLDGIKSPRTFTMKFDRGLKEIGPVTYEPNPEWKRGSKKHRLRKVHHSAFPGLSSYWARHTWATIASELDIPDATISAALGHSTTNKTTAIYIDFNREKIDRANRKVIDYVLGLK